MINEDKTIKVLREIGWPKNAMCLAINKMYLLTVEIRKDVYTERILSFASPLSSFSHTTYKKDRKGLNPNAIRTEMMIIMM